MWKRAFWAAFWAAPVLAWAAPELATVTIIDGGAPVTLIRDASRYTLLEGVRLQKDDIVESGSLVRLVRVEFADGTIADLGPDTQVLLQPRLAGDRSKANPTLYLMQGWAKLTAPKTPPTAPIGLSSAALDVTNVARQVVVSVSQTEAYAFAEAGTVNVIERVNARPTPAVTLKSDQFFARAGSGKPTISPRPTPAFVSRVPKPFLDTLPSRLAAFASREVNPKRVGDMSYADAEPWIDAEAALRPAFVTRWRSQAQLPEFRKGLMANMKAHPEWDRVVYPEKYLPKRPVGAASGASYPR